MEFKNRFNQLRLENNLTLTQVASEFHKSESAVRAWEAGRTKPDADTLILLSKFFNCSTDFLLGLSESRNSKSIESINAKLAKLGETLQTSENHAEELLTYLAYIYRVSSTEIFNGIPSSTLTSIITIVAKEIRATQKYLDESDKGVTEFANYIKKMQSHSNYSRILLDMLSGILSKSAYIATLLNKDTGDESAITAIFSLINQEDNLIEEAEKLINVGGSNED